MDTKSPGNKVHSSALAKSKPRIIINLFSSQRKICPFFLFQSACGGDWLISLLWGQGGWVGVTKECVERRRKRVK